MKNENRGLLPGFMGVTLFALTLPATQLVIDHLGPFFIGLGRALVVGIIAALLLLITRSPLPDKKQFKLLILTASGVVIGFPVLSGYAMQTVDASYGASFWLYYHWQ